MKLLIRRNQRQSLTGQPIFVVDVRAQISEEEQAHINKYRLNNTVLYSKNSFEEHGNFFALLFRALIFRATNLSISIKDLVKGKRIECKDIIEMIETEKQIMEAAQVFGNVLRAASEFGGDEVVKKAGPVWPAGINSDALIFLSASKLLLGIPLTPNCIHCETDFTIVLSPSE